MERLKEDSTLSPLPLKDECDALHGIATPEQLAILRQALDAHCSTRGITDPIERDNLAVTIMSMFNSGMTTLEEINAALPDADNRSELRQA